MRVLYSGFNMYGQIIHEAECVVKTIKEFEYAEVGDLELAYSYLLIKTNSDSFEVHGAISSTDEKTTRTLDFPEIKKDTVQFSCCHKWCLFLTKSGEIFKWEIANPDKVGLLPSLVSSDDDDDKVSKIRCGSHITVASSFKGKIFNVPNLLEHRIPNLKDFCVGNEHCILLDTTGNVYSFGRGSRGQLGHGNLNDESEPKLVEALAGIKIISVASGGWHSCALSADGDLYIWGWNSNGQLGLASKDSHSAATEAVSVMATPHPVELFGNQVDSNVVQMACGSRHTIALLDNNELYGCGWNKYNQLGISSPATENIHKMTKIIDLNRRSSKMQLKCGPWATAVLLFLE
ncbi:probable E3 ubiquitin-protein ligase HERC3 isoform X2 [Agrilus planipennis]|uniref:Probable E3 ubiquitin-protein ligase HERC3 isoform X2 n=1 Tax=Agrilus planipennis TaxID=224129 RepID=A0A1W4WAX5_AGRPL|nr:probable E3 ubiquitin-protein ligase HERC3 isoform X2 [Agrilus planipennis]